MSEKVKAIAAEIPSDPKIMMPGLKGEAPDVEMPGIQSLAAKLSGI